MPYSGPGDTALPKHVKDLPEKERAQWVEVFNSSHSQCMKDGGKAEDCEGEAFRKANGVAKKEMSEGRFLFIQLEETKEGQPVEVLRTGTFTDMHGREVKITSDDLDAFVTNFIAGEAGQDVPVDTFHERREAYGWLKQVMRDGEKLLAIVEWNTLGRQLVEDKVYKYLSATIDMTKKVIKSVSLVNFPAVKGLKPVELTEHALSFQQVGWFDAIQEMIANLMSKDKTIKLADGMPGSVTISQYLVSHIHKVCGMCINNLALSGYLSPDEQKQMMDATDAAAMAMAGGMGEAGGRLIPSTNYYPDHYGMMSESKVQRQEETAKPMDEKQLAELQEKIRAEERAKYEAELTERQKVEADLREKIRKEEAELAEQRFKRRQSLVDFANQLCNGEHALSAKADDVVAFLEAVPDDQLEAAKRLLGARIVDFGEKGSGQGEQPQKRQLPPYVRADVLKGPLTIADMFTAHVLDGKPEDYDLSDFDAKQKGF